MTTKDVPRFTVAHGSQRLAARELSEQQSFCACGGNGYAEEVLRLHALSAWMRILEGGRGIRCLTAIHPSAPYELPHHEYSTF